MFVLEELCLVNGISYVAERNEVTSRFLASSPI